MSNSACGLVFLRISSSGSPDMRDAGLIHFKLHLVVFNISIVI